MLRVLRSAKLIGNGVMELPDKGGILVDARWEATTLSRWPIPGDRLVPGAWPLASWHRPVVPCKAAENQVYVVALLKTACRLHHDSNSSTPTPTHSVTPIEPNSAESHSGWYSSPGCSRSDTWSF